MGFKREFNQAIKVENVSYAVVIGDREVRDQTISPRRRGGETLKPMSVKEFAAMLREETAQQLGR